MRLPRLNNRQAIRGYLTDFERRFVQTADGVVYVPAETGQGIRLPAADAASIIAGMRATMVEVDGRQPWSGTDAFFAAAVTICVAIMAGAISGFWRTAIALVVPIGLAFFLLGPVLGMLRTHFAWQRGLREVERRLERYEKLDVDATRSVVKPNPLRTVYAVAVLFSVAVIAGLIYASATSPTYVAAGIDRWLAGAVYWAIAVLVVLGFAYKAIDAIVRPPVAEADIRIAVHDRERRPLSPEEDVRPAPRVRARPSAMRYGNKRSR